MRPDPEHGGNIFAVARRLGLPLADTLDFSASINPLGLSEKVREAIVRALGNLVHYPDTSCEELKDLLAREHDLSPDHFHVANGSTEIIYHLPALVPGRRALIVAPAFSEYEHALRSHGWDVHHFVLSPTEGFKLDLSRLAGALEGGFDALYLCNPANPSGTLYPSCTIAQIRRICSSSNTFLVLDEAFMDFCPGGSAAGDFAGEGNVLILRSMTKFFAIPGLRLGYAMAQPELIGRLGRLGGPWSVNSLAQAAGAAALADGEYRELTLRYVERERAVLAGEISALKGLKPFPSRANFLLVEIIDGPTAPELQRLLLKQRILIRDCSGFAGLSEKFFRIAVRTHAENGRLLEHLWKILG